MPRGIRALALPLVLVAGAGAWGCKSLIGTDVVSIYPVYGYAEGGCTAVTVSGHGWERQGFEVEIGGAALQDMTWPRRELDQGFLVTGTIPPGDAGLADVTVKSEGETYTLEKGFYFEACPTDAFVNRRGGQPFAVTSVGLAPEGATVELSGCNLFDTFTVKVGDNGQTFEDTLDYSSLETVAITSICGSQHVSVAAPARTVVIPTDPAPATGDIVKTKYHIGIFDSTGTQLWPSAACNIRTAPGSYVLDTADSADFDPCAGAPTLTYQMEVP